MNRTPNAGRFVALLFACSLGAVNLQAATLLLPFGSGWSYWDFGPEPEPNWAQPAYDDSFWNFGFGQFGYGDGDEDTVVDFGPDDESKYITTYFRARLNVDDPSQFSSFTFNLRRDDGAVVYVNGVEVFRSNMPDSEIDYGTYASTRLTSPIEAQPDSNIVDSSFFVPGQNIIAVEVHQCELVSPDLSFDLEVLGNTGDVG